MTTPRTMTRRTAPIILASALALSSVAGCSSSETSTTTEATSKSASANSSGSASADSAKTVKITDAQGRTVEVPTNPETVVVTDFSVLRTLDDLGIEADAIVKPIAFPDDLASKYNDDSKVVGSLFEPDYEKIAGLNPDLVLVGGRSGSKEIVEEMTKITPNVLDMTVRPKDPTKKFDASFKSIEDIASIFGKSDEAKKQIDELKSDMEKLATDAKAADTKTMVVQVTGPKVSAYGPGSRFSYVWNEFGFPATDAPVDGDGSHGQEVSQELFTKHNPGAIFYLDRGKTIGQPGAPALETLNSKLVNATDASKNNKLVEIDGFSWYIATNAPSSIQQMITDARKAL